MSNPLYNVMNQNGGNPDWVSGFMNEVNNFKKNFSGNPQEEVQKMLNSGRMSQAQFNEYAQIANQLIGMIK